jgi:hypothetical protein
LTSYRASDERWKTSGPYDVLVMLDCIEHLERPEAVLDSFAQISKTDALFVLTTGDWASLYARVSKSHWRLMTPPQHLYFYSAHTLRLLLARFGFDVVEASHPWKVVPVGLMAYQFASRLGLPIPRSSALNRVGLPVNLFDAIRVVARKRASVTH